jgi:hypothetical protein
MGTNFHTAWDTSTRFSAAAMNTALSTLDRILSYLKNPIVTYDGTVTYSLLTGILTWNQPIRIIYNASDGNCIRNNVAAGNITISDNEFIYIDLSETNDAAVTIQKAAITTGAASNFITYNRLVLGYRNATTDRFESKYLDADPDKLVQSLASADNISVDWGLGNLVEVTLDRATTTFAFDGARDGQICRLALLEDATGSRAVAFGAEVRDGADISLPLTLSGANLIDYVGFIYRDSESKYDLIEFVTGF